MNYHFKDVWHAEIVATATGYKGNGGGNLADFLEALAMGYDATREVAAQDDDWLEGVAHPTYRAAIVEQLRAGESIIDLPAILGDSFIRILAGITKAYPSILWTWGEARWAALEDQLNSAPAHNPTVLGRAFGITTDQAGALIKLYGKDKARAANIGRPSLAATKVAEGRFMSEPTCSIKEQQQWLAAQGIMYALPALKKLRQRWRAKLAA